MSQKTSCIVTLFSGVCVVAAALPEQEFDGPTAADYSYNVEALGQTWKNPYAKKVHPIPPAGSIDIQLSGPGLPKNYSWELVDMDDNSCRWKMGGDPVYSTKGGLTIWSILGRDQMATVATRTPPATRLEGTRACQIQKRVAQNTGKSSLQIRWDGRIQVIPTRWVGILNTAFLRGN